jgi:ABC-2 type transport system permease protein
MRRLRFLVWKEFLELRQEPRLFGVVVVAPIIQLTMLGYAATTDVRDVPVVVADGDRTSASRELISRFEGSANFRIVSIVTTVEEIEPFLDRGDAWLALAVPAGYGAAIEAGRSATVQVVADGTDSNSTSVALGHATSLIGAYAQEMASGRRPAAAAGIEPRIRVWYNPRLESRFFMLPGVLALVLLVVTANLASMAIVREKELGTLEQLNVTPIRRWELIVGKLLPYCVIAMIDVLLVVAVTVGWFRVPLHGSFALLVAVCFVYVLSTLALGLFVSTVSDTQQQAMMTSTFFVVMPMIYLSGFIFPIETMPAPIQPVTYLIPLRYFLLIVRGIFLKGIGLELLWPQALALAAWGCGMFALAVVRSRKRAA